MVLEESFDAGRAAGLLASGAIAFASLVPTMLRRLLERPPGPFPGVRAVLVGGGPSDPALLAAARRAGLPALQTYGMTETASQVATEAPGEAGMRPGSAGRPLEGFEVRAVDGAGAAAAAGGGGPPRGAGPGRVPRLPGRGGAAPGRLVSAPATPDGWTPTATCSWRGGPTR